MLFYSLAYRITLLETYETGSCSFCQDTQQKPAYTTCQSLYLKAFCHMIDVKVSKGDVTRE